MNKLLSDNYIVELQDEQEQIQEDKNKDKIDINAPIECDRCKFKITDGIGYFFKPEDDYRIYFFCNSKCRRTFLTALKIVKNREKLHEDLKRVCARKDCGNEFFRQHRSSPQRYCSKECFRFDIFNYYALYNRCEECSEWILKSDSIFLPKGSQRIYSDRSSQNSRVLTTKRDNWLCPVCKSILRTTSTKYKKQKKPPVYY